jgi:hypothetical protein
MKTGAARIALGALASRRRINYKKTNFEAESGKKAKLREKGFENNGGRTLLHFENRFSQRGFDSLRRKRFGCRTGRARRKRRAAARSGFAIDRENRKRAARHVTLNLESEKELDAVLKAEALFSSVYENLLVQTNA